jgi:hypothetical protein
MPRLRYFGLPLVASEWLTAGCPPVDLRGPVVNAGSAVVWPAPRLRHEQSWNNSSTKGCASQAPPQTVTRSLP